MYIFFSSNKGISAVDLRNQLDINYKSALLLERKCRILMSESATSKKLDSKFYEADVAYIGTKSPGNIGMATDQQPFLVILSTSQENNYPQYIKVKMIRSDCKKDIERVFINHVILSEDSMLNTDGKSTFSSLSNKVTLKSEKISYKEKHCRLHWVDIMISNIKSNISGIYHGVSKRDISLFLSETEWRINHRWVGIKLMDKIQTYLTASHAITRKEIIRILDIGEMYLA